MSYQRPRTRLPPQFTTGGGQTVPAVGVHLVCCVFLPPAVCFSIARVRVGVWFLFVSPVPRLTLPPEMATEHVFVMAAVPFLLLVSCPFAVPRLVLKRRGFFVSIVILSFHSCNILAVSALALTFCGVYAWPSVSSHWHLVGSCDQ